MPRRDRRGRRVEGQAKEDELRAELTLEVLHLELTCG